MVPCSKRLLFLLLLLLSIPCHGQDPKSEKRWVVVLPLRFTQLQNTNTMLSGIKLGRKIKERWHVSISVYHSFYLNSFKAKASLEGFEKPPHLFINCVGGEMEYSLFTANKWSLGMQLLVGWGFMKYEGKDHHFSSKQVNYLAVEPTLNTEYKLNNTTSIGWGIGYRPLLGGDRITYTSSISNGELPLHKSLPNGVNLIVTLKGYL